MKKWLLFLPILFVLAACAPTEAQIQTALEQTQAAQPTVEPTSTPEDCPRDSAEAALVMLFRLHDDFAHEFNRGQEDYHVEIEVIKEITNIKRELDNLDVPLCLEYAKEMLSTSMQNGIDGFRKSQAGSLTGQLEYFSELEINIELFYYEHERISECLPGCEIP